MTSCIDPPSSSKPYATLSATTVAIGRRYGMLCMVMADVGEFDLSIDCTYMKKNSPHFDQSRSPVVRWVRWIWRVLPVRQLRGSA